MTYRIQRARQLRALASAARQEIVDALAEMGTAPVGAIARALGRPADSLYFHLSVLKRAGLVVEAGSQRNGKRNEALFRTVAPRLSLQYRPKNAANRSAVNAIVRSMLRLGIRDFRRAMLSGDMVVEGPSRELWAQRRTSRLSGAQVRQVNRLLKQLNHIMSNRQGQDQRLYGVTVLLVPLGRQRGRSKSSSYLHQEQGK